MTLQLVLNPDFKSGLNLTGSPSQLWLTFPNCESAHDFFVYPLQMQADGGIVASNQPIDKLTLVLQSENPLLVGNMDMSVLQPNGTTVSILLRNRQENLQSLGVQRISRLVTILLHEHEPMLLSWGMHLRTPPVDCMRI